VFNLIAMKQFKNFIEFHAFGVCAYLGEKFGVPTSLIRLFFIYTTFITVGSPVIIYLSIAFFLKFKNRYFSKKQSMLWDH